LDNQNNFSRTLWVPQIQRFGFYSENHPGVSSYDFFSVSSISGVLEKLSGKNANKILAHASIQYVVVPYDNKGELFLKDRKYDDALYLKTIKQIAMLGYLHEIPGFGKVSIFQLGSVKERFWMNGKGVVSYDFISPTEYRLSISRVKRGEKLIFTDKYDPFWQAHVGNFFLQSVVFEDRFNEFTLPKSGNYTIIVAYKPQEWVELGLIISGTTLFLLSLFLLAKMDKKW